MIERNSSPFKKTGSILGEGCFSTVNRAELVERKGYAIKEKTVPEGELEERCPDVRIARALSKAGLTRETLHLLYPIEIHQDKEFDLKEYERFFLIYPEMKDGNLFEFGARYQFMAQRFVNLYQNIE